LQAKVLLNITHSLSNELVMEGAETKVYTMTVAAHYRRHVEIVVSGSISKKE
jgi:hypothetical protein